MIAIHRFFKGLKKNKNNKTPNTMQLSDDLANLKLEFENFKLFVSSKYT